MSNRFNPDTNLHDFYTDGTNTFYKLVGHRNFAADLDKFMRTLVTGLLNAGMDLSDHSLTAVNSLYSQGQPQPTFLYWELVSEVSSFSGAEIPEFLRVTSFLGQKNACRTLSAFTRDLLTRLTSTENPIPAEFEYIAGISGAFAELINSPNPLESNPTIKPAAKPIPSTTQTSDSRLVPEPTSEPVPEDTETLLRELDSLTGLTQIKKDVRSLINLIKIRKLRKENNLPLPQMSLHMVFTGNPGTGKTTVARLMARLYHSIGILKTANLVETDRSGLVAGYVGQTAIKTAEVIGKAKGGILFIDEAYSLSPEGNGNDFGREAVEILLKNMEDNREDLIVIAAGYEEPMERFITSNPGLESRFGKYFLFPDYDGGELFEIFMSICDKNGYIPDEEASNSAKELTRDMYENRGENFGNARDVRNLFEKTVARHSDRVSQYEAPSKEQLMTIIKDDLLPSSE